SPVCKNFSAQFKDSFSAYQKSWINNRNIDVNYYRLELQVNSEQHYITGKVTTYFKTTDSLTNLVFDLSNHLQVDSIFFQNRLQTAKIHSNNKINIKLDKPLAVNTYDSISIKYRG